MSAVVAPLAALLCAGTGAILAQRAMTPARRATALRSALFVAWGLVAAGLVGARIDHASLDRGLTDLDRPLTLALFFFASRVLTWPRAVALLALAVATDACFLAAASPLVAISIASALFTLGALLDRAMETARASRLRTAAHALAFGSTLTIVLPLFTVRAAGRSLDALRVTPLSLAIASVPFAFGLVLGLVAVRALTRAGGTPDPLDPPLTLVATGIYARLRHPLLIAEMLLVGASAIAFAEPFVVLYAALFTAVLLGPMRMLEELALHARFGQAADDYRRRVPAFIPRWRPPA